jgi:DNA-binding SARP family transcriptional activator
VPRCLDRPGLVERARSAAVVVLTGPVGHGKTCLAAQIVDGAPVAWFTADELDRDATGVVAQVSAALGRAWPDLAGVAPAGSDDAAALPLLAGTLETVAGPGSVVVDDAHLLGPELLDAVVRTMLAALSPACRLVVCTRGNLAPSLVRATAEGRVVVIDARDLALTAEECRQLVGRGIDGDQLHSDTGGWPLAVALSVRNGASVPDRLGEVADLALADVPEGARTVLTALARLPRLPAETVADLRMTGSIVQRHHTLVEHQPGGWVSVRPWLREALKPRPADGAVVKAIVESLRSRGQPELAAHLLLAEGHLAEGGREVEELAAQGARQGRWDWVRALVAEVPAQARTLELDLLAAAAEQGLSRLDDEEVLVDLVRRADVVDPGAAIRARQLLAHFHRMRADLRCQRLRGLLELAGDQPGAGAVMLASLQASAAEEGRMPLVHLIDRDLAPVGPAPAPDQGPAAVPVAIRVLGPELVVTVAGESIPTLRGFPAKLLAVLVTRRGTMTVDAAIEALWPEADPDAGRNRLHGILLRLRRSLGLAADGPITCADGQIRVDPVGISVDSWEFEQAADPDAIRAGGAWPAIQRYPADVLMAQFAYEGPIDEYRRELRATFFRLASIVLADHRSWTDAEAVAALARRATRLAPDDEHLALLSAQALLDLSRPRQARAVVDATTRALVDLGIDVRPFARAADAVLDRCRIIAVER